MLLRIQKTIVYTPLAQERINRKTMLPQQRQSIPQAGVVFHSYQPLLIVVVFCIYMTAAIDSAKKTAAQRHRRAVSESFALSANLAVYFLKITAKTAKTVLMLVQSAFTGSFACMRFSFRCCFFSKFFQIFHPLRIIKPLFPVKAHRILQRLTLSQQL